MTVTRFSQASLSVPTKYRNMMAGSAFIPPAGDYELISTTVLGSDTTSVTFSGLGTSAAAYKHLQIRAVARTNTAASSGNAIAMRFNADSGANYAFHILNGASDGGGAVQSYNGTSQTSFFIGSHTAASATGSAFAGNVIDILDFASTKNKTARGLAGHANASLSRIRLYSGLWMSTSAITSITLYDETVGSNSFVTGSRFSLYGLKG